MNVHDTEGRTLLDTPMTPVADEAVLALACLLRYDALDVAPMLGLLP